MIDLHNGRLRINGLKVRNGFPDCVRCGCDSVTWRMGPKCPKRPVRYWLHSLGGPRRTGLCATCYRFAGRWR